METKSAEQELAYIRTMISNSRTISAEDGVPSIVAGLIVAIALFITYLEAATGTDLKAGYIWLGLSILGGIYIMVSGVRSRKQRVITLADTIRRYIWFGCGMSISIIICMTSLTYLLHLPTIVTMYALCPVTAAILGTAYLLHGAVRGQSWVRNLSIAWWLGAIVMFLWPGVQILAIESCMILLFIVVPGIILQKSDRQAKFA